MFLQVKSVIGLFLLIGLCLSNTVQGQTCCSAGAPLTSTFQIANDDAHILNTQVKYTYRSINRLVDNREILVNDPRSRLGNNLLLKLDYSFKNNFAVSAVLPYVFQSRTTISEEQSSAAIGDLLLVGQKSIPLKKDGSLSFSLGAKLPTGKVDHLGGRGVILSPDMQSGSGTFDFLLATSFTKYHFLTNNLAFSSNVLFRKNTTNNNFGGTDGVGGREFKFGDELLIEATLAHQQVWGTWFSTPYINLNYRFATANREEEGNISNNSGGQWLGTQAGLQLAPNDQYNFKVYGQVPFFQALEGTQITTDFEVGIEFNYKIRTKKKEQTLDEIIKKL